MSPEQFEPILDQYNEGQFQDLKKILEVTKIKLTNTLQFHAKQMANGEFYDPEWAAICEARLKSVNANLTEIEMIFKKKMGKVLPESHTMGSIAVRNLLDNQTNVLPVGSAFDTKALPVLIKDANNDFRMAISQTKRQYANYFKFSKQAAIMESEFSRAAAIALGVNQTPDAVKGAIRMLFNRKDIRERFKQTKSSKIFSFAENPEMRSVFEEKFGKKELEELERVNSKILKKQFIQIINKNGRPMNFDLDDYSEMVARHRITQAQIAASLEEGERRGITLYRVTDHNTTADVCRIHEGKIYTTDPELARMKIYPLLVGPEGDNRPGYHPRCSHRIFPYVQTNRALIAKIASVVGKDAAEAYAKSKGIKIREPIDEPTTPPIVEPKPPAKPKPVPKPKVPKPPKTKPATDPIPDPPVQVNPFRKAAQFIPAQSKEAAIDRMKALGLKVVDFGSLKPDEYNEVLRAFEDEAAFAPLNIATFRSFKDGSRKTTGFKGVTSANAFAVNYGPNSGHTIGLVESRMRASIKMLSKRYEGHLTEESYEKALLEQKLKDRDQIIETLKTFPFVTKFKQMLRELEKTIDRLEKKEYRYWTVSERLGNSKIYHTIVHEIGHTRQYTVLPQYRNGQPNPQFWELQSEYLLLKNKKELMTEYQYEKFAEYIAETYTWFRLYGGEKLSPKLRAFYEGLGTR